MATFYPFIVFCFVLLLAAVACRCSRLLSISSQGHTQQHFVLSSCSWASIVYILTDGGASTWAPFPPLFLFLLGNKEKEERRRPFPFPSVHTHSVHKRRRPPAWAAVVADGCTHRHTHRQTPLTNSHCTALHAHTLVRSHLFLSLFPFPFMRMFPLFVFSLVPIGLPESLPSPTKNLQGRYMNPSHLPKEKKETRRKERKPVPPSLLLPFAYLTH